MREPENRFFQDGQSHFFKPLTGKYREVVVACLTHLYLRLNGPEADYSYHLVKSDVIEIFSHCVRTTPLIEDGDDDGIDDRLSVHDRAGAVLRKLRDSGWIEEYLDSGNMRTAYRLTPMGRRFAAQFSNNEAEFITSNQNTRSTLSHLESFLARLEAGQISEQDLMIAAKLSGEIIADFNAIIEDVVEQRRKLIGSIDRDLHEAKAAGEGFIEYMSDHFIPDLAVRFDKDSVERFRADINRCLGRIRALPKEDKARIEKRLRQSYPNLIKDKPERSILWWSLDLIEQRLNAACDSKLPELREQTESFIRRAQMLISHLSSLALGEAAGGAGIFSIANRLSKLDEEAIAEILADSKSRFPQLELRLLNPARVVPPKVRKRRALAVELEPERANSAEDRRNAYIRRQLALLFRVDESSIGDYIVEQLAGGHKILASQLKISDVASLLGAIHAPMLGTVTGTAGDFRVSAAEGEVHSPYHSGDNYMIEYIDAAGRGAKKTRKARS